MRGLPTITGGEHDDVTGHRRRSGSADDPLANPPAVSPRMQAMFQALRESTNSPASSPSRPGSVQKSPRSLQPVSSPGAAAIASSAATGLTDSGSLLRPGSVPRSPRALSPLPALSSSGPASLPSASATPTPPTPGATPGASAPAASAHVRFTEESAAAEAEGKLPKPPPRTSSLELPADVPVIPTGDVEIVSRLGAGNFAEVFLGQLRTGRKVALKRLRDQDLFRQFSLEAALLARCIHPNVVSFLGVYLSPAPFHEQYLVCEYLALGSLDQVLRDAREDAFLPSDLLTMMIDAASGMTYLESNGIVHRDLACRNLLMDIDSEDRRVVKVSDMGMARETQAGSAYYYASQKMFPVRWTAPESIATGRYSSKSDVFSFGVTIWEAFSNAAQPYSWMKTNEEVIEWVTGGRHLPQPSACPPALFDLMLRCWQTSPHDRPKFADIAASLQSILAAVLPSESALRRTASNAFRSVLASQAGEIVDTYAVA